MLKVCLWGSDSMNKQDIKNIAIRSIKPLASSLCLIGLTGTLFAVTLHKKNDSNPTKNEKISNSITKVKPLLYSSEPELEIEETIENNPALMNFNVDYMIATADEKLEMVEEIKNQEFIDNMALAYVTGYDEMLEVEVDNGTFELTYNNKTYEFLPLEDFYVFLSIVAAECNGNPHDALATASSILNRCDSENWSTYITNIGMDGTNPVDQATAPGQYNAYASGLYKQFLNGNVSEEVLRACEMAWYEGIRSHNYTSFRGRTCIGYSNNQVVDDGNRFGGEIIETACATIDNTHIMTLERTAQ